MRTGAHGTSRLAYPGTLAMLILALLFPIGLMVFNPTLMFERGWEQYVGTSIYFWAVLTLGRELLGLWRNERAFKEAPELLNAVNHATAHQASRAGSFATDEGSDDGRRIHSAPRTPHPAPRSQ